GGRSQPGVDGAPAVVAVGGEGEPPAGVDPGRGVLEPQHGGVAPGSLDRVEEELVVVLAVDPAGVAQLAENDGAAVGRVRDARVGGRPDGPVGGGGAGPVVQGGGVVEAAGRNV